MEFCKQQFSRKIWLFNLKFSRLFHQNFAFLIVLVCDKVFSLKMWQIWLEFSHFIPMVSVHTFQTLFWVQFKGFF